MTVLQQGLLITAIGMGLVFAVIILLWGLMALMMRVTSREETVEMQTTENPKSDPPVAASMNIDQGRQQAAAAAAAVQIALNAAKVDKARKKLRDHDVESSPWQLFHLLRQLGISKRRG